MGTTNAVAILVLAKEDSYGEIMSFLELLRQPSYDEKEFKELLALQKERINRALDQAKSECVTVGFQALLEVSGINSNAELTAEVNKLITLEEDLAAHRQFIDTLESESENKDVMRTRIEKWLPVFPLAGWGKNVLAAMEAARDACAKNWLIGWGRGQEQDNKVRELNKWRELYKNAKLPQDREEALKQFLLEAAKPRATFLHIKEAKFGETTSITVFFKGLSKEGKSVLDCSSDASLSDFQQKVKGLKLPAEENQSSNSWVNLQ